ncbi:MAG: hypothetical protein ACWGPN_12210 [Gammaproteobacteria bacterium]
MLHEYFAPDRARHRPVTRRNRSWICVLAMVFAMVAALLGGQDAMAGDKGYNASSVRGEWIISGLLKFAAPIPIPAQHIHEAPPHTQVAPGDVVGIWGALLGTLKFDGQGGVIIEDVFSLGEIKPVPPVPLEALPPSPEFGAGTYTVSDDGVVEIFLLGRDPGSPAGQVDFETDYYCLLNRQPAELKCVISRFVTYFVDPNGFQSPLTGVLTATRRH